MKKKLSISMIIFIILIVFLLPQSSSGMELEKCRDCHGKIKPIPSSIITKDCVICHNGHNIYGRADPKIRTPEKVHDVHGYLKKRSDRKDCQDCHYNGPVECIKCHNSHDNTGIVRIKTYTVDMSNTSACIVCHGKLPRPGGHEDFRNSLSNSKHRWTNCRTCHLNVEPNNRSYGFELHFKDLSIIKIEDSIDLCKICHSLQYNRLKEGIHGGQDKVCVDCHDPHTTKLSGPNIQITLKETPINISTRVESAGNWITTKVPILKNTTVLIIIILIIAMTVAEYILSKVEEGKKTAYDTIKINDNEDTLKTLEIKLKNQNINTINEILEMNGANILGMTMKKEDNKDVDIYKYVIFMNIEKLDENVLVDKIVAIDDVWSAIFTDRYEL